MERCDFLIVGAGIAGASAGYELARHGRVVVIERESQPGYHSTGRSAALYTQTYGHPVVRALTIASWDFFRRAVGTDFTDLPVMAPRGVLLIGREDQRARLEAAFAEARRWVPTVELFDAEETRYGAPMLREGYAAGAIWEPGAMDLDVHAIHQGFLRGLRQRGGEVVTDAGLTGLRRMGRFWFADTAAGSVAAPVLINAAGAWADEVAALGGVPPIGVVAKRRTAILFDPVFTNPARTAAGVGDWPMVVDVDEAFYFKPDAGRILASPADETPVPPCDAQPEELDVAVAVDRIERATDFAIRRITHKWAGLRCFVADKVPVAGFDTQAEGFFWLAGQGGYGIKTSPALARVTASLVTHGEIPADLVDLGITAAALSPRRLAV